MRKHFPLAIGTIPAGGANKNMPMENNENEKAQASGSPALPWRTGLPPERLRSLRGEYTSLLILFVGIGPRLGHYNDKLQEWRMDGSNSSFEVSHWCEISLPDNDKMSGRAQDKETK